MPKRLHLNRPDLAPALVTALKTCQDVKDHKRLLALRMTASGEFTAAQIAIQVGSSRRQLFHWIKAFKRGGVAGLLRRRQGGGAPPQLSRSVRQQLVKGLKAGQWKRAKEIRHWLAQTQAVELSLSGVYYWLGKCGGVLKVPRKTHAKQNVRQAARFRRTLAAKLKRLTRTAGGKPVRIWVADEHRYGLIPVVRKCWTLRGRRPKVLYQTKYEWGYLGSALEVDGDHAAEFWCVPEVSLAMNRLFLEQLVARDPQAVHVVIQDQAGFHLQPKRHVLPPQVRVIPLPPYSPELNPTEAIGDLIKDRLGNELWPTLAAMETAIGEEVRPLYTDAARVRSLVSHPWLIEQVNATAAENSAFSC